MQLRTTELNLALASVRKACSANFSRQRRLFKGMYSLSRIITEIISCYFFLVLPTQNQTAAAEPAAALAGAATASGWGLLQVGGAVDPPAAEREYAATGTGLEGCVPAFPTALAGGLRGQGAIQG